MCQVIYHIIYYLQYITCVHYKLLYDTGMLQKFYDSLQLKTLLIKKNQNACLHVCQLSAF